MFGGGGSDSRNGEAGNFPGGGGSGAATAYDSGYDPQNRNGRGGNGANGEVIITFSYTLATTPTLESSVSESYDQSGVVYINPGGSTLLTVTNPEAQAMTYQWYKDGQLIPAVNGPSLEVQESGDYYVIESNSLPDNIDFPGAYSVAFVSNNDASSISGNILTVGSIKDGVSSPSRTIKVVFLPQETGISIWSPNWAGISGMTENDLTNWNDLHNWVQGAVPTGTSRVYIPGHRATAGVTGVPVEYFPYLTDETPNAYQCQEIYLALGAEIGNPHLLNYNYAHVQYNLGLGATAQKKLTNAELLSIVDNGPNVAYDHLSLSAALAGDNVIARSQWHTFTALLHGMVSGDYGFGDVPRTFIRKFDANLVETGSAFKGNWTNTYASNVEPLSPAEGYAIWINAYQDQLGYRETATGLNETAMGVSGRTVGLSQINGILEFPYHNNDYVLQYDEQQRAHRTHQILSGDESKFYRFTADLGLIDENESIMRSMPNRFAFEGLSNYTINKGTQSAIALVGNPYPSTIDFDRFYAANSALIKNGYTLWTGTGFSAYSSPLSTGYGSVDGVINQYIAPGQSFMVELAEEVETADLVFPTSITVQRSPSISSSLRTVPSGVLTIEASNASGKVRTGVGQHPDGSIVIGNDDISKILPSFNASPEVYTLKADHLGAIRGIATNLIPEDTEMSIPIGLATTSTGAMSLTLSGMDEFRGEVVFIDRETGKEIRLTGQSEYVYECLYTPAKNAAGDVLASEDRFFLRISKELTDIPAIENTGLQVGFHVNETGLHIYSNSLIRSIALYDINGWLLTEQTGINAPVYSIPLSGGTLSIAKVITDSGVRHLKVINIK